MTIKGVNAFTYDLSVTSLRKKMLHLNHFPFKILGTCPGVTPRTHISPTDTVSADLFSSVEGQSPASSTKYSFKLLLNQGFRHVGLSLQLEWKKILNNSLFFFLVPAA